MIFAVKLLPEKLSRFLKWKKHITAMRNDDYIFQCNYCQKSSDWIKSSVVFFGGEHHTKQSEQHTFVYSWLKLVTSHLCSTHLWATLFDILGLVGPIGLVGLKVGYILFYQKILNGSYMVIFDVCQILNVVNKVQYLLQKLKEFQSSLKDQIVIITTIYVPEENNTNCFLLCRFTLNWNNNDSMTNDRLHIRSLIKRSWVHLMI